MLIIVHVVTQIEEVAMIKETLVLAMLVSLALHCFGMIGSKTNQYATRYLNRYLNRSYTTRRMPKNLTDTEEARIAKLIIEDEKAQKKVKIIGARGVHQWFLLRDAVDRLQKVSFYERLFGKPSSFDNLRRKIAEQDIKDTTSKMRQLNKQYETAENKWYGMRKRVEKILRK
jgi:hypothetical protein